MEKEKYSFRFVSIRRSIIPVIFFVFTILLVIFSESNIDASRKGLVLWANNIVPSLLPFFIATELLGYTNIVKILGRMLEPVIKPIFNIPGCSGFPIIMGIISRISNRSENSSKPKT